MKKILFILPLICLITSCTRFEVRVNGFTSTGTALQLPPRSSISIVEDPNVLNPIFEKEIAGKIQKLLSSKGYATSTFEKSNFYLTFKYDVDSRRRTTGVLPIYHTGGTAAATYFDSSGGYSYSDTHTPGYTTYMPYVRTFYTRRLALYLIDAKKYREKQKIEPVWTGEIISSGSSADLKHVINYMLVAAFEHFGENTKKRVREILPADDERVKFLVDN